MKMINPIKPQMKLMNPNVENLFAAIAGLFGGTVALVMNIMPFAVEFKQVVMAFACGAAGIAGKHAINKCVQWWTKRRERKQKFKTKPIKDK